MENNTLIGQPDQPITPDQPDPQYAPVEPEETDNTKNLIMYIGAGLLLYLFVFKKK